MVRVDVRHDQSTQAPGAELDDSLLDFPNRLVGVHTAVEEICFGAVDEQEDVDESVLEWNRQPELENAGCDLAQRGACRHPGIVAD